jgi:ABC-type dipeptide/oligopeptide/nickel transport system permease subunit
MFTKRKPVSAAAALVLIAICLIAVIGPHLTSQNPNIGTLSDRLQSPSGDHVLGTDEQGRDIWARLMTGGRTSVSVGLGATILGVVAGTILGLISGYGGGWVDMILQRFLDAIMALPPIILLMVLATALSPNVQNVIIAIAIYVTPGTARVIRGAVLSTKEFAFIEASRSIGATPTRVVFRHILPNVVAPIIVIASITVGGVIITEAALGFLGLSVPPPSATWGNMLNTGVQQYMEQDPWLAIVPGIAIAVTVFAVNMFGDGLRDVLDPKLRGKGH